MRGLSDFAGDCRGAIGIDWIALGAGLLLLGAMVVYDVYLGATVRSAPMHHPDADAATVSMDSSPARSAS